MTLAKIAKVAKVAKVAICAAVRHFPVRSCGFPVRGLLLGSRGLRERSDRNLRNEAKPPHHFSPRGEGLLSKQLTNNPPLSGWIFYRYYFPEVSLRSTPGYQTAIRSRGCHWEVVSGPAHDKAAYSNLCRPARSAHDVRRRLFLCRPRPCGTSR